MIACGSLYHELASLIRENDPVTVHYLDTDLHRTPAKIPMALQQKIDEIDSLTVLEEAGTSSSLPIILGYGLCSNGVVGVKSRTRSLVIPRVHDCLDLFLGFVGNGISRGDETSRHYYLTPGTLLNQKDPYSMMTREYLPKMGEKMAHWGMKEELKHYTHFILIVTPRSDMEIIRQKARQNADFFDMELVEKQSDMCFLKKLIQGPYDENCFIHLSPGEAIEQSMFI